MIKHYQSKIGALQKCLMPKSVSNMRRYMGPVSLYRMFINFGAIIVPITGCLCKSHFDWSREEKISLKKLKNLIRTALVLALLDCGKYLKLNVKHVLWTVEQHSYKKVIQ